MSAYLPSNDGRWVSYEFETLARVVKEYDHCLELCWIPPEKRTINDQKPYMIVDTFRNQPVFFAGVEDTPLDILTRLYEADAKNGNVLDKLNARNAAAKALQDRVWRDRIEEANEEALFFIKTPLNYIKFNGHKLDNGRRMS